MLTLTFTKAPANPPIFGIFTARFLKLKVPARNGQQHWILQSRSILGHRRLRSKAAKLSQISSYKLEKIYTCVQNNIILFKFKGVTMLANFLCFKSNVYIYILSEDVLDQYRMICINSDLRTAERNLKYLRMIRGTNLHLKAVWDTSIVTQFLSKQLIQAKFYNVFLSQFCYLPA